MHKQELRTVIERPASPQSGFRISDDIELPGEVGSPPQSHARFNKTAGSSRWFGWAAAILVASAVGWIALGKITATENTHQNWKHVSSAEQASMMGENKLIQLEQDGTSHEVAELRFSRDDLDFVTTTAVRQALLSRDILAATKVLQEAQSLPPSQDKSTARPTIESGSKMEAAIKRNRQKFFRVHVYDCCDEDGDVVDLLVNRTLFARVPITHKGTTLSIPLQSGNNTITLRGVKDGRGGITVSFSTSQGNYFSRAMREGEEQTIGVVAR